MTTGSCFCDEVAYEISGKIKAFYYCHCPKCRKMTGSAFQSGAWCKTSDFRWLRGDGLIQEYDGPPLRRFCSQCGSMVPALAGEHTWIPAGCLEDAELSFTHHIFVGSKATWFNIADDLTQYDGRPGSVHVPDRK